MAVFAIVSRVQIRSGLLTMDVQSFSAQFSTES